MSVLGSAEKTIAFGFGHSLRNVDIGPASSPIKFGQAPVFSFEAKTPPPIFTVRAELHTLISAAFNSPEMSDFKILCDGEIFFCHKIILSVGSEYFRRMFLSDTSETKEGQVTIVDVSKSVLKIALRWMYGEFMGNEIDTPQMAIEVYKVADRLWLKPLKESLVEHILRALSAEIAFEVYKLGDIFSEERLKATAVDVMKKERAKVFASEDVFHECYKRFPSVLHEILADP